MWQHNYTVSDTISIVQQFCRYLRCIIIISCDENIVMSQGNSCWYCPWYEMYNARYSQINTKQCTFLSYALFMSGIILIWFWPSFLLLMHIEQLRDIPFFFKRYNQVLSSHKLTNQSISNDLNYWIINRYPILFKRYIQAQCTKAKKINQRRIGSSTRPFISQISLTCQILL